MKTKVKAVTSFVHGRTYMRSGDEAEFTKGEAEDLEKVGLVQRLDADGQTAPADEQDDASDMLGGDEEKADSAPSNKMEPEPKNKAASKSSTKAK